MFLQFLRTMKKLAVILKAFLLTRWHVPICNRAICFGIVGYFHLAQSCTTSNNLPRLCNAHLDVRRKVLIEPFHPVPIISWNKMDTPFV